MEASLPSVLHVLHGQRRSPGAVAVGQGKVGADCPERGQPLVLLAPEYGEETFEFMWRYGHICVLGIVVAEPSDDMVLPLFRSSTSACVRVLRLTMGGE